MYLCQFFLVIAVIYVHRKIKIGQDEDFANWYFSHVEIEQIKRHCVLCMKYEQRTMSQDSLYIWLSIWM